MDKKIFLCGLEEEGVAVMLERFVDGMCSGVRWIIRFQRVRRPWRFRSLGAGS